MANGMDYRLGRASDEDRRRVMLDDSHLAEGVTESDGDPAVEERAKSTKRGRSTTEKGPTSGQIRLTDLMPIRAWMTLAIATTTVLAGVGVHFAHLSRESLRDRFGASAYIFDVDQPGSLGRGLASALVIGATLASYLIYLLRRHKGDDYRGYYGIWLWVAIALSVLSLVEYTGAAGLAESLVERNAPIGLLSRLPLIIHTVVALGALLFLARLGAEMQRCRSALAVLAVLLGAVGCVVAIEAGWRPPALDFPEELLGFHARLASRALLFVMLLVYGRYARLDASGKIKVREKKLRKKAPAVTEKAPKKEEKVAPLKLTTPAPAAVEKPVQKPQVTSAPVTKPAVITAPKPVLTLGSQKPSHDHEESSSGRLSRAERRRLKQLGRAA